MENNRVNVGLALLSTFGRVDLWHLQRKAMFLLERCRVSLTHLRRWGGQSCHCHYPGGGRQVSGSWETALGSHEPSLFGSLDIRWSRGGGI